MYNYNFNINFLQEKTHEKSCLTDNFAHAADSGACTSRIGADQYDTSAVGEVNRAVKGTVVSVRQISIASNNGAGTLIGGAAGGVAGSMIGGSDTAHILGAIGGAVVGGIAGNAAQEGLSSQSGYEYVIQLDNGSMVTVSQGNDVLLNPGQKCMVLYGKRARVVPYYGN